MLVKVSFYALLQSGNVIRYELINTLNNISQHNNQSIFYCGTAYPPKPWLVEPFSDNGAISADKYSNNKLSKASMEVENDCGRLKVSQKRIYIDSYFCTRSSQMLFFFNIIFVKHF